MKKLSKKIRRFIQRVQKFENKKINFKFKIKKLKKNADQISNTFKDKIICDKKSKASSIDK